MIVKKLKARGGGSGSGGKSKAANISDLTNYLCHGERRGVAAREGEEVLYVGGQGFAWEDLQERQQEMIALATVAVRSKNPVTHYMMSWQEGEQPTEWQADEAVGLFMEELGLKGHQVLYGLHRDTANTHLHLAVNRVHPLTEKPVKVNGGFDIRAAHRAIARIEHAQGWRQERRGRYQVNEQGEVVPRAAERQGRQERRREPRERVQQLEARTGEVSAERQAIEQAAPVLRGAESWEQLHEQLGELGMRFEKKGSGALVWVGETAVKASAVERKASLPKLEARLGAYEPGPGQQREALPRKELGQRARDFENQTGEQSAQRQAIEQAGPVLRNAQSWAELHQGLAKLGMRYERKGSGALVWVGEVPVKASSVDREASFRKMQLRLGEYVAPEGRRRVGLPRAAQPTHASAPRWQEYRRERERHYADKNRAWDGLKRVIDQDRQALLGAQKKARQELFARDWRGKGQLLNAMRSVLAADQAAAKAKQREQHTALRRVLREKYQAYPGYEAWLRSQNEHELAEQWRYRDAPVARIEGPEAVPARPQDIRDFVAKVRGAEVEYRARERAELGAGADFVDFVDRGKRIDIHAHQDKAAVRAALQLGAQKWGPKMQVWGNARYLELCVQVAAEDGIRLHNPELQARIAQHRERARGARGASTPSPAQGAQAPARGASSAPASPAIERFDGLLAQEQPRTEAQIERVAAALAAREKALRTRLEQHGRAQPGRAWFGRSRELEAWEAEGARLSKVLQRVQAHRQKVGEHRREALRGYSSPAERLAWQRVEKRHPELAKQATTERVALAKERAREAAQRRQRQQERGRGRGRGDRGR